uniref:Uncharacterized protein n=1 Tax=Manihot esculenta TaxID=3983 RepID=A0A2C9U4Z8_MANES
MKRVSPAISPANNPQQLPELLSKPGNYAFHGKIMLLLVVGIFSIFLLSLVLLPFLKHSHANTSTDSRSRYVDAFFFRKRRIDDDP